MNFFTAAFTQFLILGGVFQIHATALPAKDGPSLPSPGLSAATSAADSGRGTSIGDGWGFGLRRESSRKVPGRPFFSQPSQALTETGEPSREEENGKDAISPRAIAKPSALYESLRLPSLKPKGQPYWAREPVEMVEKLDNDVIEEEEDSSAHFVARKEPKTSELRITLLPSRASGLVRVKRVVSSPKPPASSKYADRGDASLPSLLRRRKFRKVHEKRPYRHDLVNNLYSGSSYTTDSSSGAMARAQRLKIVISGFQF